MAAWRVILVSHQHDEHGDAIEAEVQHRGGSVDRVGLSDLPAEKFVWSDAAFTLGSVRILADERPAGLWRRTGQVQVQPYSAEFGSFVESESRDAFEGGLEAMSVKWLSSPHALRRAERKLFQVSVGRQVGADVPATLVTNDAPAAKAFVGETGECVVKPVRYGLVSSSGPLVAWTRKLSRVSELDELRGPPIILQQFIPATRHLRIVTVGDRALCSALSATGLDWREDTENHWRFSPFDPPLEISELATRIASSLGVGYTSQDWIEDGEGRFWFLEANPNGQWLFLDEAWNGSITRAFVDALQQS